MAAQSGPERVYSEDLEFEGISGVSLGAPFLWLAAGVADFRAAPAASLFYGASYSLLGGTIVFFYGHVFPLTFVLMGCFMLIGPALAMGLYSLSQQRERGAVPRLRPSLVVWRTNVAGLAVFALVTCIVFLAWVWASLHIYSAFYASGLATVENLLKRLLSLDNIEFVIVYLVVGGVFASLIFSISVVAVPLMLDRRQGAVAAMRQSTACVVSNPLPMMVWAGLIVLLTGIGFATAVLGLAVTAPVVGHASWHAYRALIQPE